MKESDYLLAIYNQMRALSCSFPTTSSETREHLINLLNELRSKDIEETKLEPSEPSSSSGKRTGAAQHIQLDSVSERAFSRFSMCFFRTQNVLFTRIGIDELESLHSRQNTLFRGYLTQSADAATNKTEHVKKLIYVSMILIFIAHATITDA